MKTKVGSLLWRVWRAWRGSEVGSYDQLPDLIRAYASGKSFVDIGCMWGVNGEYAFIAEEAGAGPVCGVDVFGPTPEFAALKQQRNSVVEFILGDACQPETIDRVGVADIVFCAGVLYHHPSPFDLLIAIRRMCAETLILRTSTIPEIDGLPNAAVFYPGLDADGRKLWNLSSLGVGKQLGITDEFEPAEGYGNWLWGLTPGCVASMLEISGFRVLKQFPEPFACTFICSVIDQPFEHRLPGKQQAEEIGETVSRSGKARPS